MAVYYFCRVHSLSFILIEVLFCSPNVFNCLWSFQILNLAFGILVNTPSLVSIAKFMITFLSHSLVYQNCEMLISRTRLQNHFYTDLHLTEKNNYSFINIFYSVMHSTDTLSCLGFLSISPETMLEVLVMPKVFINSPQSLRSVSQL